MYTLVVGDLEPDLVLTAKLNDVPQDLSTALSVTLEWVDPNGQAHTGSVVAVDATLGVYRRVWDPGDTDLPGYYRGRLLVSWPGNEPAHFPNDGSWIWWAIYS